MRYFILSITALMLGMFNGVGYVRYNCCDDIYASHPLATFIVTFSGLLIVNYLLKTSKD